MSSGARWKTLESYVVDTSNLQGLEAKFITDSIESALAAWETAAGNKEIFGGRGAGSGNGAD